MKKCRNIRESLAIEQHRFEDLSYRNIEYINPLKTKRNLLYIKTLCVPHSKHFQPRL
jgi:hypothetical protein